MVVDRKVLIALVAAFAVGCWWNGSSVKPSPWAPEQDRPVLRWIARAAKSFLWIAVFAEEPPVESRLVHSPAVGEDGYPMVDHGQGW